VSSTLLDLSQDSRIDPDGAPEALTTVHDAVADSVNVGDRADRIDARFWGDHPAHDPVNGGAVVSYRGVLKDDPLFFGLQLDESVATDPLDHSPGQTAVGVAAYHFEVGLDDLEAHR